MLRRRLGLRTTLRRGTRDILAQISSRETHMARTKERISLSMPSLLLPSRRRRKIKQSCLAPLVESLAIFPKSVWSERTAKEKRRMSTS